jgi:AcrR family transcriptional regulator
MIAHMNDRSLPRGAHRPAKTPRKASRRREKKAAPPAPDHRARILESAEALFSTRGFHGTSIREIAERAGVSAGNAYNHFDTKEALFAALMAELEKRYLAPDQPIPRALAALDFPDGLESIGLAARDTVRAFAGYIRLIYVDVTEFNGEHVQRLYGQMKDRYRALFDERFKKLAKQGKIGDVDPLTAIMLTTISYMYYFTVEHLFGVERHYGMDDAQVIREFARVFRNGILKR